MSLGLNKVMFVFLASENLRGTLVAAEKRNRVLRNKFWGCRDEMKETHPHIVEWFDTNHNREVKTEIIANCFKKAGKHWHLDLDKPFFNESKKRCV